MFRHSLEKFLYQTNAGKIIEVFIGVISFISSVTFIILTYLPANVPCWMDKDICSLCNIETEEFNFRIPIWFHITDVCVCVIYLLEYFMKLFISQNRCSYFMSRVSIMDLLIIIPSIVCGNNPYRTPISGLFF